RGQAVGAMILGRGEATWPRTDGVYHYSLGFERTLGRVTGEPPPDMALLFFPGNVKPWDDTARRIPWIAAASEGQPLRRRPANLRLRAYRDPKGWGVSFTRAARAKGVHCTLFNSPRVVPTGLAFVRLDQQGGQREVSKRIVSSLHRMGVQTLPTAREAIWYDDKGAQLQVLRPWMPRTVMFR